MAVSSKATVYENFIPTVDMPHPEGNHSVPFSNISHNFENGRWTLVTSGEAGPSMLVKKGPDNTNIVSISTWSFHLPYSPNVKELSNAGILPKKLTGPMNIYYRLNQDDNVDIQCRTMEEVVFIMSIFGDYTVYDFSIIEDFLNSS
jgi:hypothetical protein